MNLFNNLSISNKLLIILLLVSVIPLFIVTFGFYRLGKGRLTEQTIHTLEVQAKNVNATVDRYVNYKFKHIYKLAKMSELISILRTNEEARPRIVSHAIASFQARLRIDPDFLSISLLDREGNVVFSTDAIIHGNYAARHFFSVAAKGRKFVSEPCVDGGIAGIYFSIPVKQANKILGVATLRCGAEEFWELFEHESGRVGQGNAVILSNSDGVRIAHSTKMDLIFKVVGGLLLANKADGGRFTLRDEETLLTITYQASVAIENAKLYDEVRRLAITDGLTGLLNHNEFYRRLNEHIEGSKRYQYAVSLLMMDIDHFKHFNDTYGHQVGDYVLKVISGIIKARTRAVDVCARYGGEEFAVILRESDAPYAGILSERICSTVYAYPFKAVF